MRLIVIILSFFFSLPAAAGELQKHPGWEVIQTQKTYNVLLQDVRAAVTSAGLVVVTQAGPTKAAAARGIQIPGNRILGVFNNDYAVRVLALSLAAMIEAPIRLYVTENSDGYANLSYKKPSYVFAPYQSEGGSALMRIAAELDKKFATIARTAQR